MIIQQMLKNNEVTLKGLSALLGMKCLSYPEGYTTITYDQFATPSTSRVAAQCRGVIFDEEYNIVCRPFDRFYNLGEPGASADSVDFAKSKIVDKVDGSLIKIWYDAKKETWRTATSGRIYGEAEISDHGFTFKELVYKAINVSSDIEFNKCCETFDKDTTYIYEVTSRENRIVTRYEIPELWYLAARKNKCGKYVDFDGTIIGAKKPKEYNLNSISDCVKAVNELENYEEGYVIYMDNIPFMKIKSPQYVQAHLIKGEDLSVGRICNLIINNEIDEYLSYFPEDKKFIQPYFDGLQNFYNKIDYEYEQIKDISDHKELSVILKGNKHSGIIFNMVRNSFDARAAFDNLLVTVKKRIIKEYKTN